MLLSLGGDIDEVRAPGLGVESQSQERSFHCRGFADGYFPRCLSKKAAISPNATAVSGKRSSILRVRLQVIMPMMSAGYAMR